MPFETIMNVNSKCIKLYQLYYSCLVSNKKECNLLKDSVNQCLHVKKNGTE